MPMPWRGGLVNAKEPFLREPRNGVVLGLVVEQVLDVRVAVAQGIVDRHVEHLLLLLLLLLLVMVVVMLVGRGGPREGCIHRCYRGLYLLHRDSC